MRSEVTAVLGAVAADEMALHPGDPVLVGLEKLRRHAAREPLLDLSNDLFILDEVIPAPFVPGIELPNRPPADAHGFILSGAVGWAQVVDRKGCRRR
jgi:hypothetical protein